MTKMSIEELSMLIENARWFEHLAKPFEKSGCVQIFNLAPWADIAPNDTKVESIADNMDWLPSSRNEADPIHGRLLEERCIRLNKGSEYARASLEIYAKTLAALRSFVGHDALKVGPHDFVEAARGAALFASRRAAYEVLLGESGFWCSIISIYAAGHWPCGTLPNGEIVVL